MKIVVDYDLCEGNAMCQGTAPDIFRVDDSGQVKLLQEHPPESARAKVEDAVRGCPTQALSVEEE